MDISSMKNMIVLKNLPSNIVEEAIVILKANKKIKKLELIQNKSEDFKNSKNNKEDKCNQDYIVKEAELVISNYISKIEDQDIKGKKELKQLEKKYKNLKVCTVGIIVVMTLSLIFNVI